LLSLLGLASLFVLAVACANAMGACLALGSRRSREFAVRVSLGASRLQLARQSLLESSLVAAVAAVAAIGLAHELLQIFVAIAPALPRLSDVRLPAGAELLAGAIAGACGLLLAVAPLLAGHRRALSGVLQAVGHTSTLSKQALRYRRVLLATQVAVVLALLTASGLVMRTLWQLIHQPLGFDISHVLSAEITPTRPYFATPGRYQQLMSDVLHDVRAAAGSREAAVAFDAPLSVIPSVVGVEFPDGSARGISFKQVSDGFFRVMRIPMLAGRDFLPSDYATGRFLIVNETFARTYFGGVPWTVGRSVRLGPDDHEIVGVVADVRDFRLTTPFTPTIYPVLSAAKWTPGVLHVVTRERGDLTVAATQVRAAVFHADPSLHVTVEPLDARMRVQTATARFQADALGALAAFTLLLAAFGTYALVDQIGHERARELALRAALGADSGVLVRLMLRSLMSAAVVGVIVGAWLSWATAQTLRQFLFHTSPLDRLAWIAAAACLALVAGLAAWMPARNAAGVDPAQLLRQD
jgi:predicted permease